MDYPPQRMVVSQNHRHLYEEGQKHLSRNPLVEYPQKDFPVFSDL